jgi:hypothetical protein
MIKCRMQQQPHQPRSTRHRLLYLPLLFDQLVHLQPLSDALQVDFSPTNLLPAVVLEARLLRSSAELSSELEDVLGEWTSAHVVVVDLRILGMFGAENPQAFAVGHADGIEEVAEHRVAAFDASLEDAAETCLRLVLVEASLHVTDGGSRVDFVATRHAVHRRFVLHVDVLLELLVKLAGLRMFHEDVELRVAFVQFLQCCSHDLLLRSILLQRLFVQICGDARRAVPLLQACREDLKDSVGGELHSAYIGAVFRLRAGGVAAFGTLAVTGTFQSGIQNDFWGHRALSLPGNREIQ